MYQKIPRRLRYVLWSGTMFPWRRRRRLHLMMATFIYLMIPTFIYRCVHLSVRSSYLLIDDVHQSVRSSISWSRRSSNWTSFVTRCLRSHLGSSSWTRCSHQRLHLNGSFERKRFLLFVVVVVAVCCWLRFACGGFVLSLVCFLLGPGALLLLLMFFEPGFQEDSLRKHKN